MADLSYPAAAGLTLALELPVYAVGLRRFAGLSWGRAVVVGVVVNVVSHPALWFVVVPAVRALSGSHVVAVVVAEALVFGGEAAAATWALPDRRRWPAAAGTAVAANALSLAVGLLIQGT